MVTEIREGSLISVEAIKQNNLTYQGKKLNFKCIDEQRGIYKAEYRADKESGNVSKVFTFSLGPQVGHLSSSLLAEGDEFKDLTDAQKHTKIHSLEYQTGIKEQTQPVENDGSFATEIGQKAHASNNKEEKSSSKKSNEDIEVETSSSKKLRG